MKKKVSIIIPVYNISEYIEECVKSLWNQTYNQLEIILINDGSTDNSGNICDELASKDKRIISVHKKNGGISEARNAGIDLASGEYLFFLDGDDYLENNTIEVLVRILEKNKADISAILKVGHSRITDEVIIGSSETMLYHLLNIPAVEMWGKLYKKKLFDNIRFPIGKKHEDLYILPTVIFGAEKIVVYHKGLYNYRVREDSIMGKLRNGDIKELVECCLFGIQNIKKISKNREYVLEIQKWYFYHILWYYYNVIGIMQDEKKKEIANKEIALFYKKTFKLFWKNPNVLFKDKFRFTGIYLKNI